MKTLIKISSVIALLTASLCHAGELAVIVNASNPVDALSPIEVKQYYLKHKARWAFGKKVRPSDYKDEKGMRDAFLSNVLSMSAQEIERYWIEQQYARAEKPPATLDDDSAVVRFVKKFEGGIGFVDRNSVDDSSGVKEVLTLSY